MRTLIPFFLLILAVTVWFVILPQGLRKTLFSRRNLAIAAFIVMAWIAVLALAAVQSNFVVPLF